MKKFELDWLGQYYAGAYTEFHNGSFSMTVNLKESLSLEKLQKANAKLRELHPYLSGRVKPTFFGYEYELTEKLLPLILTTDDSDIRNEQQVFRVKYGEKHFTVEVTHTLCDGRTLASLTTHLLELYLGIEQPAPSPTNLENAYERFATKTQKEIPKKKVTAYRPPLSMERVGKKTFNLSASQLKEAANSNGATLSEYLLALIFQSIEAERQTFKNENPVIISVPVDCRSFFPSKTMRNFVDAISITMPESKNLSDMAKALRRDFSKLGEDFVGASFSATQQTFNSVRYVPRFIKDMVMRLIKANKTVETTATFSNVGKISLKPEVLKQVDSMVFHINLDDGNPYCFSCVTVGDVLSLTVSLRGECVTLIQALEEKFFTYRTHLLQPVA